MSAVEHTDDGAVLLGDPPILKLESGTSLVVVNAGGHPLDARTRELAPEAIEAMRDWCEGHLRAAPGTHRPGSDPTGVRRRDA
ncbi:MAG TPA: hypothetical protein VHA80_05600 [Solirubrobacterales bacterium]|nr:hypothetical protein [Solirubrobacterales bacterium]